MFVLSVAGARPGPGQRRRDDSRGVRYGRSVDGEASVRRRAAGAPQRDRGKHGVGRMRHRSRTATSEWKVERGLRDARRHDLTRQHRAVESLTLDRDGGRAPARLDDTALREMVYYGYGWPESEMMAGGGGGTPRSKRRGDSPRPPRASALHGKVKVAGRKSARSLFDPGIA